MNGFSSNRRQFLKSMAVTSLGVMAGLSPYLSRCFAAPLAFESAGLKEFLAVCATDNKTDAYPGPVAVTKPGRLNFCEVAAQSSYSVDLPFFGHTATQISSAPSQVLTLEKWGRRGAQIDLQERSVGRLIEATDGHVFFGHTANMPEQAALIFSEDTFQRGAGQLAVRDVQTMRMMAKYPSYGGQPHECRVLDGGKTILVANEGLVSSAGAARNLAGQLANVAWIEASSGKLLHKIPFSFGSSHITVSEDGWILVGGSLSPGHALLQPSDQSDVRGKEQTARAALISPGGTVFPLQTVDDDGNALEGEILSAAFIGQTGYVAYTAPNASRVYLWHYHSQELVGWADVHMAKGVLANLHDPDHDVSLLISTGKRRGESNNLLQITLSSDNELVVEPAVRPDFEGNGSHLVRMYV